jgi:glycosyltransferase involved in cell wall biosynthesis
VRQGISVVVPVYNSEPVLTSLVDRLVMVLRSTGEDHELIFVEDGSKDKSWRVLKGLSEKHACMVALRLQRNSGQHAALLCGIRSARFDRIVTLDDDLQNPPEEIPRLLGELDRDLDVVYGFPRVQQHGLLRNLASSVTKRVLQRSMGAETAEKISAFRVFRTQLRESFSHYDNPFVSIDVLLTWGTTRFGSIDVDHHPREFSTSGYGLVKLLNHAANLMTGFTTAPLQFASLVGFSFSGVGILAFVFALVRWIADSSSVPGFTFLASATTLFAGVQLLCLGIIGEYLARIHTGLSGKRPYSVGERVGAQRRTASIDRRGRRD